MVTNRLFQMVDSKQAADAADGGRERVNLSVSPELRRLLKSYARTLGMTEAQLVLHGLLLSIPQLQDQVRAVRQTLGGDDV